MRQAAFPDAALKKFHPQRAGKNKKLSAFITVPVPRKDWYGVSFKASFQLPATALPAFILSLSSSSSLPRGTCPPPASSRPSPSTG